MKTHSPKPHIGAMISSRAPLPVRLGFSIAGRLFPKRIARLIGNKVFEPRRLKDSLKPNSLVSSAERITLQDGPRTIDLYTWGKGSRSVLLVHGWEGSVNDMTPFVTPLLSQHYRVLALELPAHGRSVQKATDVHDIARAIRCAVSKQGSVEAVVAHSIGSTSAAVFASDNPGLLDKLVLIAPGGDLESELNRISHALGLSGRCLKHLKSYVSTRYNKPLSQCSTKKLADTITTPTLVIHDVLDRITPYMEGKLISESLPVGTFFTTHGLGHRNILKAPEVALKVTAFLAEKAKASRIG